MTVKNTLKGTNTDAEGNYALAAASNDVLVFEFIGYESAEATVGSRTVVDVTLKESVTEMDQVVVVGYGTMEKKMVTSAISSVSGGELMPARATPAWRTPCAARWATSPFRAPTRPTRATRCSCAVWHR